MVEEVNCQVVFVVLSLLAEGVRQPGQARMPSSGTLRVEMRATRDEMEKCRLLAQSAESPIAGGVAPQRGVQLLLVEIGPVRLRHPNLRVADLP
jgi:hypothetical protein